jgi:hypothetical protein
MMRWDTAGGSGEGAAWDSVIDRTVNGFTNPAYFIRVAPFLGHGIGTGSNVGARLTSGTVGFMLAEEEWGKVLLELGPVIGSAFILFRIVLTGRLGWLAWRALRENRNVLPLLIFAAVALAVLQGQWGPPTVLGFAVAGAGLLLGALRPAPVPGGREDAHERAAPAAAAGVPVVSRWPTPSGRRPPGVPRRLPS